MYNRVHSSCSQSQRKRNCMSNIEDLAKNIRRLYRSNLLDLTPLILTTIYAAATRESSHHHHKHYASISDLPVAIASCLFSCYCFLFFYSSCMASLIDSRSGLLCFEYAWRSSIYEFHQDHHSCSSISLSIYIIWNIQENLAFSAAMAY